MARLDSLFFSSFYRALAKANGIVLRCKNKLRIAVSARIYIWKMEDIHCSSEACITVIAKSRLKNCMFDEANSPLSHSQLINYT